MDTERFKTKWSGLGKVYISSIQYFNDGNLTLYVKENVPGGITAHEIKCTGVLRFRDTGLVGNEITYFDINNLMGIHNWFYAEKVGLPPKEYIELVFIDQRLDEKPELIVACKDAVLKSH